ncbi:MAG: histidine phosphatase family protein [Planctomycetota bacterium]
MSEGEEVLLIRHGEVEARWKKVCYGAMDVALSERGRLASNKLAEELVKQYRPATVFHSGLSRTRYLAEQLADRFGADVSIKEETLLRERDYGQWQGLSWDAAYQSDADHFHDLIDKPDTYRPPGGETTSEMQQRMVRWLNSLPSSDQPIIAVSHSGPITALVGYLLELPAAKWNSIMPAYLDVVRLSRRHSSARWRFV